MKKKNIVITLIFIILILIICVTFKIVTDKNKTKTIKKDDTEILKESLEKIFYFLPNDKYDDMNTISDYCKLALIYDTDYLKSDYTFKNNNKKGYTKENIINTVKNILGNNASINFNADEDGQYNFLLTDACMYGNLKSSQ